MRAGTANMREGSRAVRPGGPRTPWRGGWECCSPSAPSASRWARSRPTPPQSAPRRTTSPSSSVPSSSPLPPFCSTRRWRTRRPASSTPRRDGLRSLLRIRHRRIDWWAAAIQLLGTLWFNRTTLSALLVGLGASSKHHPIWRPDALGSICFLVSSWLAWAEECDSAFAWRPWRISWWITALNLVGSVAFGVSAVASYVTSSGQLLSLALTNLGTFVGALCFLAGSILLLPERTRRGPRACRRPSPGRGGRHRHRARDARRVPALQHQLDAPGEIRCVFTFMLPGEVNASRWRRSRRPSPGRPRRPIAGSASSVGRWHGPFPASRIRVHLRNKRRRDGSGLVGCGRADRKWQQGVLSVVLLRAAALCRPSNGAWSLRRAGGLAGPFAVLGALVMAGGGTASGATNSVDLQVLLSGDDRGEIGQGDLARGGRRRRQAGDDRGVGGDGTRRATARSPCTTPGRRTRWWSTAVCCT